MSSNDGLEDEELFGPDPRLGSVIQGRFRLESLLGQGRSGRVYRATQFPMNRPVVVKVLMTPAQQATEEVVRRFGVLIAKSARLSHPHTVTLIDYGASERRELFIAMELVPGPSLASLLDREGSLDWERTVRLGLQMARSLRDAHYNGVIHRGFNPNNVFLVEGDDDKDFVKVSDFGVFGVLPTDASRPPPPVRRSRGNWDARLVYTAPEQITGAAVDPRADVYALGCVLYEMLADRPPFTAPTSAEVARMHVEATPPTFEELGLFFPPALEDTIRACLAKTPQDRIGSMGGLMLQLKKSAGAGLTADLTLETSALPIPDLAQTTQSEPPRPPTSRTAEVTFQPPSSEPPTERVLKKRAPVVLALVVALVSLVGGAVWFASREAETTAPSVRVEVLSSPSGAAVFVDGDPVGSTPATFEPASSDEERLLLLRKEGFVEQVELVIFDEPKSFEYRLEPISAIDEDEDAPASPSDDVDYKQNPY